MTDLNTNLSPITITNNKVLKKIWDKNLKLTLADVIDNRRTLFNGDYNLVVNEIFKMYLKGKPLKYIEAYIIKNLK